MKKDIKKNINRIMLFAAAWALWTVSCEQTGGGSPSGQREQEEEIDYLDDAGGETYVPYITGVAISSYPAVTYFAKGQPFSYEGLKLSYVLDNGEYDGVLKESEYTVADVDTEKSAPPISTRKKEVRIDLDTEKGGFDPDYHISYNITIDSSTSILGAMTMTMPPAKLSYELGQDFSAAGMEVSATYSGGDRDGESVTVDAGAAPAIGYNKYRRGAQTVTLMLNGQTLGTVDVTLRIPANATVTLNRFNDTRSTLTGSTLKPVRIKRMPFDMPRADLRATVYSGSNKFTLDWGNCGITEADTVTGYDKDSIGQQRLTLRLNPEGYELPFDIYVADAEAEVWFDYGYRRHKDDPNGAGPGAGVYYANLGEESLVLSPARFLLGYGVDGEDLGVSYSWEFSGPSSYSKSISANGEFCTFTPQAAGDYTVRVDVTGRDFVSGAAGVTKTAVTRVVCYTGTVSPPAGKTYNSPTKHFAPGQHNEGKGYGWSLGAALGYEFWSLPNGAAKLEIYGNPFGPWGEAGIVWVQYDANGNGVPDEMWYELTGDEDDTSYKSQITRRYALSYFRGPNPAGSRWDPDTGLTYDPALDTEGLNSNYAKGQSIQRIVYWVDCKGRVGRFNGWPFGAALSDDLDTRVTFTGTLLRDTGRIAVDAYNDIPLKSYVDCPEGSDKYEYGQFNVARDAIRANGSPAGLNPALVRFVKVQTAFWRYGGVFGNISTEIVYGTNLANQANGFPMP
jgi:hypothetical protein